MKKYCFALDLKEDDELIAKYENWHRTENAWPEITKSITDAGIVSMEIYRTGNRLFMIMEVEETFDFHRKAQLDLSNPKVQEWEALMNKFQQKLPWAKPNEKWVLMDRIYKLENEVSIS